MAIPESQLATWSHQGSITQSSNTYKSIKTTLEEATTPYSAKTFKIFLQGSYGNATNIYSESDVDIVIRLDNCFQHDLSQLPAEQQDAFENSHNDATYTHVDFKADVISVLSTKYGNGIEPGEKAIAIAASGNRRKADVIAAIQYRRYHKFLSTSDQSYDEGICFYTSSGTKIANYPKQHSDNLTTKHQCTSKLFKPMARILKNLRSRLIEENMLEDGVAPSYYLEGLLYNVPNDKFGKSYEDTFVGAIDWIMEADRSKFVCANEQYYLLFEDSPVTWRVEKCDKFLATVVELWKQW
jgi:hypothetical protein